MKEIERIMEKQRCFFESGATKPYAFRIKALRRLEQAIEQYEREIKKALKSDLNKSSSESYMTEISLVKIEINHVKKNLRRWMSARPAPASAALMPGDCFTVAEPYGLVLVMAPWNYPVLLCLTPMIGAIAAGNCVIIKPSAYAPAIGRVLKNMLNEYFYEKLVAVIEGGREENEALLNQKFDYIFFTGGKEVGKIVLKKAAKFLTPVTLELGGKSPCIVDESADLKMAAKRIVFGKLLNAGQTCVAPDYILAHESIKENLLLLLKDTIRNMLGDKPLDNEDYPRIINEKHFNRILGMLGDNVVSSGGGSRKETLQIEPTILGKVTEESPVMAEEIFGPLLPVLAYQSREDISRIIRSYDKPLALYLFTQNIEMEEWVLKHFSFGGGCINNTIMQMASPHLPFGGVGGSGMGAYHGRYGFQTFSHIKSIVRSWEKPDVPIRYQPYNRKKDRLIRWFAR